MKYLKYINEGGQYYFYSASEAKEIIIKTLKFLKIEPTRIYDASEDYKWELDDVQGDTCELVFFEFPIDGKNNTIWVIANEENIEYDGSSIIVLFFTDENEECNQADANYLECATDLVNLVNKIRGYSNISNVMKKINGIKESMKHIETFKIYEKKNTFINFRTFDLEKWYGKLNTQFFNGKLKKVPLRWNQSKKELGVVKWDEKSKNIYHLGISDKFKLTESEVLSVLSHEMIHIWQIQNNKTDGHGNHFKKEMKRINSNSKWGINVMSKQPMGHLKQENPDLDKDYGFLVIKKGKDKFDIAVFDPKKTDYKNLLTMVRQNKKGKVDIEVRSTQNGIVKQYKKESTNKTISTYKLDDLTFNTLMNDSKKISGGSIK